ncbi:hypothetical protein [Arsenophonus sp.]|uniref:hypothetical protein n=1 Tax=Arsenophonus sp. TaxID=1872640 RepID=UPI003879A9BD
MFSINKINFNPLPNYQSDTQRASSPLSTIEKQHIHFLDSLYANENISYPLHSYDEALALLTPLYDKDYIENKSKINFVSTMNEYNQSSAYKKCSCIDWYTIQDYQYSSYAYLNNMLKLGTSFNHHHPLVKQLAQALMHLSLLDNYNNKFTPTMLYRGEVRKLSDMIYLKVNGPYTTTSFFSTTKEPNGVIPFLKEIKALADNEVNVLYEIQHTESLVGANISDLLKDDQQEVLFWPKTEFIITYIEYIDHNRSLTVRMNTANIEQHEWDNHLYALF